MKRLLLLILLLSSVSAFAGGHIVMSGPPVLLSCPLMLMADDNSLAEYGYSSEFIPWSSPDQYRALLASDKAMYVIVSTLEYVRLSKIIKDIKLIFSEEGSPIWFLGEKENITIDELSKSTVALPFRGDMPEILLSMLLSKNVSGGNKTKIVSAGGGVASAQLVMTGRADYVAVPEPIADNIVKISEKRGLRKLKYSLSVEEVWDELYQGSPPLLVSNIVAFNSGGESAEVFSKVSRRYFRKCIDNPQVSADVFVKYFPVMNRSSVEKLIKSNKAKIHPAEEIQDKLSEFIKLMKQNIKNGY